MLWRSLETFAFISQSYSYLQRNVKKIDKLDLETYRKKYGRTWYTLMSNGWTNNKFKFINNFLVNSPSRTVYLKLVDTSVISKYGRKLFELLDFMIQEIGVRHIMQICICICEQIVKDQVSGNFLEFVCSKVHQ